MKRDAPRFILAPVNRKNRECYCNIGTKAPAFRITVTVTACGRKQFRAGMSAVDTGGFRAPACSSIATTVGIGPLGLNINLSDGWYLRSSATWNFNLESGNSYIPVGAGVGKVFQLDKGVTMNASIEPQYTVWHDGPGAPR
ncbi:hypothetical protein [Rhizobium leguminosarum]|uniref:hypothetical protein n=1 Tax=Rhizobium leguminosarum TaxID=384 RepID=UPI001FEF5702|nr:hypothetical protein [Rhizobium leguminosarum]